MIRFRRRHPEDAVHAARAAAELAEANERAARAVAETERANAEAQAVRDRAAVAARERDLKAAIRLGPLEAEAARLAAEAAETERVRTDAAREANDAAEAERARTAAEQRAVAVRALVRRRVIAAAFVGVSCIAIGGQTASYAQGAKWPVLAALGVALVAETIGIALGWLSHEALLDDEPAGGLQLGAYAVAVYVGMINYWHWSSNWAPTPEAALFTGCSVVAPWLWSAYSKRTYAAKRKAEGRPLERAPRYGLLRWALWTPETFGTVRLAIRTGESDPHAAAIAWEINQATNTGSEAYAAVLDDVTRGRRALTAARTELVTAAETHLAELQAHETEQRALEANDDEREDEDDGLRVLPGVPSPEQQETMTAAELAEAARRTVRAARLANIPITGRMIGDAYNRGDRWGQLRIADVGSFVVDGTVDEEAGTNGRDEKTGNGKRVQGG